jgi:CBS domain-containing protein
MFDLTLREVMGRNPLITVNPEATVMDVSRAMASANTGAVVVIDAGHAVGIFTERDAVYRVVAKELNPATTAVRQVMTNTPLMLPADATYGLAMAAMHEHGFRHIPVTEQGRVIGMVTARNALDPELEEFVSEERRREHWGKLARDL